MKPTDGVSATRACPVCRGENVASREVCGRCGVDLDTGHPLPDPALTGPVPPERGWSGLRRRWWLPFFALVIVAAGVVGGLRIARVGPFAERGDAQLPEVSFDSAAYGSVEEPLPLSSVATLTSAGTEGERSFTPEHLGDEDVTTAWHSQIADLPEGANEVIDLFLEEAAWVSGVVIHNGDHHDASTYEATPRIRRARLVFDGGVTMVVNLLDLGREAQVIELPEPVLTTTVRIEILSAVPGGADRDVAVSEATARGFPADPEDRERAEHRADLQPATGPVTVAVS